MIKKVEGIVISEVAYGETSKIINVFTKEYGIIGVIAKGAKSLKSKLRNYTVPFTYGYFHIYYKEEKLSTLIECEIIDELKTLKTDIVLMSYLNYLIELSTQIYKQSNDQEIYTYLISILKKMNQNLDPTVLTNILEIKLLDYLGIALKLDGCVKCNNTKNIVTISPSVGGYLCNICCKNELLYDDKVIKMMRMYYLIDIESITDLNISKEVKLSINKFLNNYYDQYTGLYLQSKDYLNKILKE